jgi:hypothetical protein
MIFFQPVGTLSRTSHFSIIPGNEFESVEGVVYTKKLLQYFSNIIQMQPGVFVSPDDESLHFALTVKGVAAYAVQVFILHPFDH